MTTDTIKLLNSSGKEYQISVTQQTRLLQELKLTMDLCKSHKFRQFVLDSIPLDTFLKEISPTLEFLREEIDPFRADQIINGDHTMWYPHIGSWYLRTNDRGVTSYLSLSSYWPALLRGVASIVVSQRISSQPAGQVCLYGLQPCVRPEKQEDRWRRTAFTQAHIDFVSWGQDRTKMCKKAIDCIYQTVVQLTGISANNVRIRVGDARGWSSLLESHFTPRTIQLLRKRLLDPIAGNVALHQGNSHLLAQHAASVVRRLSQNQLPDELIQVIIEWIETGGYGLENAIEFGHFQRSEIHQLAQLCNENEMNVSIDARSGRTGYSGLTWQIDCYVNDEWIEVAGGGDYSDAAILCGRLQKEELDIPGVIVVGSAVGVERAIEIRRGTSINSANLRYGVNHKRPGFNPNG